ncbi:15579_t:CDS:1, partial [Dentiscutata erythropus]
FKDYYGIKLDLSPLGWSISLWNDDSLSLLLFWGVAILEMSDILGW